MNRRTQTRAALALFTSFLLALGGTPALAQSAAMTVPGRGQMMAGSGVKQTMACNGGAVTVNGSDNKLTLTGTCSQVTVSGSDNKIVAATVGRIVLVGSDNTFTWGKALKGSKPLISVTGSDNLLMKR